MVENTILEPKTQRYAQQLRGIETMIETLMKDAEEIRNELILAMITEGLEEVYLPDGKGFKRYQGQRSSFTSGAIEFIKDQGIADLFRAEPSVTQAAIDKLVKARKLTEDQLNSLYRFKFTHISDSFSLKPIEMKATKSLVDSELERVKSF